MMEPLLHAINLSKVFPVPGPRGRKHEFRALDNVNFSLAKGESLGIVGESGSGKSTTARIVAGLETASSGLLYLQGAPLTATKTSRDSRQRARIIKMVLKDPFGSLNPRQKIAAGIDELLTLHFDKPNEWRQQRTAELLEKVGLTPSNGNSYPRNLSGGQRQRVSIARALALEPELLILDEAVSALDVSIQAQVLNLLTDLRADLGISYLFISHDLAVIRQVSDNCLVMSQGAVVEYGTTESVLNSPKEPYTQQLLAALPTHGWTPRRRGTLATHTASLEHSPSVGS